MRIDYTRAAAAILVTISCAGAFGQVQVQQNNPLDANPQVGSGGSNQPVQGYVPVNGNDIVTGNVSGLKYFHQPTSTVVAGPGGSLIVVPSSSLGTFSPYAFQGSLGSSSFNNFARQSAGGSQTNIGATRTFYLPSSTVSTGQGSLYSAPYGGGYESALIPRYSAAATTSAGDVGQMNGSLSYGIPIHQFSVTPANVGAVGAGAPRDAGSLRSPLFGTRPNPLSVDLSTPDNGSTPDAQKNGNGTDAGNTDNGTGDQTSKRTDWSASDRVTGAIDGGTSARVRGQSDDVRNANVSPTDRTLASNAEISDTYKTLLQRLDAAQAEAKKAEKANQAKPDRTKTDRTAKNTDDEKNGKTVAGGNPAQTLDPLTGQPRVAGTTGVPGSIGTGSGFAGDGSGSLNTAGQGMQNGTGAAAGTGAMAGTSGYRARSAVMARSRLENLSSSELEAGKQVAPMKSFVDAPEGGKVTPFDELMKNAETLLKSGKYMEAADAYQTAITTEPDNALAVIGRAQAELGGGMYESAAGDLQTIFARKPALMAVHYPIGDFIPLERQNYLVKDLQTLTTNPGPGNTASFLLSYIFYNTGRTEDLSAELGRWSNRPWRNEWVGVADKAWK